MASKGVNKVILVGTAGNNPEVQYMPNGNPCLHLSIATSDTWTDKASGKKRERTEWHRVVVFGKLAEIAGEYLRKGSKVYFEGRNQTREWEKDGIKRYITEIIVDQRGEMQLLGSSPRSEGETPRQQPSREQPPREQPPREVPAKSAGRLVPQPQRQVDPQDDGPLDDPFEMGHLGLFDPDEPF